MSDIKESIKQFFDAVKAEGDTDDCDRSTDALDLVYITIGFKNGFCDAENLLGKEEIAKLNLDATDEEIEAAISNIRDGLSKTIDIEKMSKFIF